MSRFLELNYEGNRAAARLQRNQNWYARSPGIQVIAPIGKRQPFKNSAAHRYSGSALRMRAACGDSRESEVVGIGVVFLAPNFEETAVAEGAVSGWIDAQAGCGAIDPF